MPETEATKRGQELTTAARSKPRSTAIIRIEDSQRLTQMPLILPTVKHSQNQLPSAAASVGVVKPRIVAYAGTQVPIESSAMQ